MEFKYGMTMALVILFILMSIIIAKNTSEIIVIDPLTSFYNLEATSIKEEGIKMDQFKGKKILIVNVASKCGLTPQYKELEDLYQKYSNNLVVLGFPSNDFFRQEPGSNEEIASFCSKNYSVTFPLFEKVRVKGSKKHAVYQWLTDPKKNGWNKKGPSWNFTKYLIDENGKLIKRFSPRTSPLSSEITSLIK
jgi:glutathione peroxidase